MKNVSLEVNECMNVKKEQETKELEIESIFLEKSLTWRRAIETQFITMIGTITGALAVVLLTQRIDYAEPAMVGGVSLSTLVNLYRAHNWSSRLTEVNQLLGKDPKFQMVVDSDSGIKVRFPKDYYSPEDVQVAGESIIRVFKTGQTSLVVRNQETGKLEPVELKEN